MTRLFRAVCLCLFAASTALYVESKNPTDYPLRLHIFGRSETTFYHDRTLEESKGEGRANLFANGDVHGVDFSFDCSEKLKASFGFETYPAKWKKQDQELIVLLPVFGKANAYFTCNLKTQIKDYTYVTHDGRMSSEPTAEFKTWMSKHEYDPEHGKNTPIRMAPQPTVSGQPAPPAQ
ncbi:MAG TPA: hypothetical protein VIX42_11720 [Edaphobacter sp.]